MSDKFYMHYRLPYVYLLLIFGLGGGLCPVVGQSFTDEGKTLRISGRYSHIFKNNNPWITNNFHFVALTTSGGWTISVTNDNISKDWGVMRYDGTNIYTLKTDVGDLPPGIKQNPFAVYGNVFPGYFYLPESQDSTHLFLPWMAFHLTPQMIQHSFEHNGVIEMPWPWGNSRYSLLGYGYKWKLKAFDNKQIIQKIDTVRDSALDLKTSEDELRRSILNYPFSISARDDVLEMMKMGKSVPDGFVISSYECTEIFSTNDTFIPSATKFIQFWPDYKTGNAITLCEYALSLDRAEILNNVSIPDLVPPEKTHVSDYRYQAANSRTKYNYASYILEAGDHFKSDKDQALLAEAQKWLKYGPKYSSYKSSRILILVGMITITLISSGILLFWLKPKSNEEKINKINKNTQ